MTRMKKWWRKRERIPRWNFSCWYGGWCKRMKNDEEKEAEFSDDTFPFDMEEVINDINDENNEKNDEEKEA